MTQPRDFRTVGQSPLGTVQIAPNRQPPSGCACHPGQPGTVNGSAAQAAPPPLVSEADVQRYVAAVREELGDLGLQLDGLELLAQSNVLAAPLRATLDVVRGRVGELHDLALRAASEVQQRDQESTRWASTVGLIRTVAAGIPVRDLNPSSARWASMDAVLEVQQLVEQRDQAREIAARLEAENADLVSAKLQLHGAVAELQVLRDRINGWRDAGKVGRDAVRRALSDAGRAGGAAVEQAGAAHLAELFYERRCRACGCTAEDCSGCIETTGQPCHWVEPDLCSACVTATGSRPAGGGR